MIQAPRGDLARGDAEKVVTDRTEHVTLFKGGGVDYAFSQRLAIRLVEFNYYRTRIPANFGPIGSPNGNDSQNNITIGVGVVIR